MLSGFIPGVVSKLGILLEYCVNVLVVPFQRILCNGSEAELAEVQGGAHLVLALGLPLDVVQDPPEGVGVAALVPVVAGPGLVPADLRAVAHLGAAEAGHQLQLYLGVAVVTVPVTRLLRGHTGHCRLHNQNCASGNITKIVI